MTGAERPNFTAGPALEPTGTSGSAAAHSLWGNRDFVMFWFGETVSLLGTQITVIALPLTAVFVFGAGPEELGLLRFLQLAPYLMFGLLFGVWVDRVRRRLVMLGANAARMLLVGLVPLLAFYGELNATRLLAIAFGIGIASVLFDLSWMSYVPTLVKSPAPLVEANSKLSVTSTASETVGPATAGLLVSIFSAPIAMAIDAFTYLGSLVSLLLITVPEPRPTRSPVRRRLLVELTEGLRWVWGNRLLRSAALIGSSCNFLLMANSTMFVLYAVRDQAVTPGALGLIWSISAVGGLLGAVLSQRLIERVRLGLVYAVSTSVVFVPLMLIPAAGGPTLVVRLMFGASFFLSYLGLSVCNVILMSIRQRVTPEGLLGRMNATMRTLMFGGGALGGPVAGLLAVTIGLRETLWTIAIGAALMVIPVLLSPITLLDAMPPAVDLARLSEAAD